MQTKNSQRWKMWRKIVWQKKTKQRKKDSPYDTRSLIGNCDGGFIDSIWNGYREAKENEFFLGRGTIKITMTYSYFAVPRVRRSRDALKCFTCKANVYIYIYIYLGWWKRPGSENLRNCLVIIVWYIYIYISV